jgi:outer membrane receptor protein involved in Fe transport
MYDPRRDVGVGELLRSSSSGADGLTQTRAGNRIPLVPRHTSRLTLDYAVNDHWEVSANLIASAGVYLHGNENNANQAGEVNGQGDTVLGSGWASGYAVVNLRSTYHLGKSVDVLLRLANSFDKYYATAGFLTTNSFNTDGSFRADPEDWTQENSVSPAQPRAVWAGVRWRWR